MVFCWLLSCDIIDPFAISGPPLSSYLTNSPNRIRKITSKASKNPGNSSFSRFVSAMAATVFRLYLRAPRRGRRPPYISIVHTCTHSATGSERSPQKRHGCNTLASSLDPSCRKVWGLRFVLALFARVPLMRDL